MLINVLGCDGLAGAAKSSRRKGQLGRFFTVAGHRLASVAGELLGVNGLQHCFDAAVGSGTVAKRQVQFGDGKRFQPSNQSLWIVSRIDQELDGEPVGIEFETCIRWRVMVFGRRPRGVGRGASRERARSHSDFLQVAPRQLTRVVPQRDVGDGMSQNCRCSGFIRGEDTLRYKDGAAGQGDWFELRS